MKMILGTPLLLLFLSLPASAGEDTVTALSRSNAQNYKDRALASCIASAYEGSAAGADARITTIVFYEWLYYDIDLGNPGTEELVDQYLLRDYSTPIEGYAGAEFKLLKCIDMYHSPELEQQSRDFTYNPDWIGAKPPAHQRQPAGVHP